MRQFRLAFAAVWMALILGIPGGSRAASIEEPGDVYIDVEGPVIRLAKDGAPLELPAEICSLIFHFGVRAYALSSAWSEPIPIATGLILYWPDCEPETGGLGLTELPEGTETIWVQDVPSIYGWILTSQNPLEDFIPPESAQPDPEFTKSPEQAPLGLTRLLIHELLDDLEAKSNPSWPWRPHPLKQKLEKIRDGLRDTTTGLAAAIEDRLDLELDLGLIRPVAEQLYGEAAAAAQRAAEELRRCERSVERGGGPRALNDCTQVGRSLAEVQRATAVGHSFLVPPPVGRLGATIQAR